MKKIEMQEAKRAVQQMTLLDNFLFREVVKEPELFDILVNVLMEQKIQFLECSQVEKVLGISPLLREIRLDVFNMDTHKHIYSVEMQRTNTGNLQRRSRLYQAQLDVSLLPAGTKDFNEIKDVFLIMICPFDLFGKGACRYTFHEVCEEYPELKLENGGSRMFINTKGTNRENFSREFVELLDYINAPLEEMDKYTTTEPMKRLHEGIQHIKELERTGMRYMQRWEERMYDRMEARAEGRKEGLQEGENLGVARQIVEMGMEFGLSVSEILKRLQEKLNISLGEAEEYFGIYSKQ